MRRKRRVPVPSAAGPAAAGAAFAAHLPEAGKVVSVGLADVSRSWRTRVEQVDGAAIELVAPTRTLGEAIVPDVGRPVVMGWATDDGYFEAECSFAGTGVDTVVTWVLSVRRIARLQRRSAFRIDTSGPVTLRLGGATIEAKLRNLSEGGLCCAVPVSVAPDEHGDTVEVCTELEELGWFETAARIVRVSASTDPNEVELGVAFTGLDDHTAESLRQFVFAEQLRRRRTPAGR